MAMTDEERKARKAERDRAYRQANAGEIAERKRAHYQANAERERERQRAYREANHEQVRERDKAYYQANAGRIAERQRAYYQANPEQVRERVKAYCQANPEQVRERQRAYREANPEKVAAIRRSYYQANKAKIMGRTRERLRDDPQFKVAWLLREWLRKAVIRGTVPGRYGVLLGCTASELRTYVESLFQPGMTWENRGTAWELDHIRALSSFDLLDPEQLAQAGHHTNLMPLTKAEHKAKSKADQAAARQRRKQSQGVQP